MPTNADAHRTTVTRAAARARRSTGARSGSVMGPLRDRPHRTRRSSVEHRRGVPRCTLPSTDGQADPEDHPRGHPPDPQDGPRLRAQRAPVDRRSAPVPLPLAAHLRRVVRVHARALGPRPDQLRGAGRGGARDGGLRRLGPPDRAPAALLLDHRPLPPLCEGVPTARARAGRGLRRDRGSACGRSTSISCCARGATDVGGRARGAAARVGQPVAVRRSRALRAGAGRCSAGWPGSRPCTCWSST